MKNYLKKIVFTLLSIIILTGVSGCKISGSVKDENGRGIPGVIVYLSSASETQRAITDQNGAFSFKNISSGIFTLKPGAYGQSDPESYEIEKGLPDETGLSFTLTKVSRIGLTYGSINAIALSFGIDSARNYRKAIQENNGIVVTLSTLDTKTALNEKLETLHGVILPGGIDIDPSFYGEAPHEKLESVEKALDLLEFDVLDYAESHNLPVLGICRGIEVINVFYGGTLYQDLPSQFHASPVVIHRGTNQPTHDISIYPETWLHEIMGSDTLVVNTFHHQGIKELADGFTIAAVSMDGLIEAIEKDTSPLVAGVQFHPELLRSSNPEFNRLFEAFMTEVKNTEQLHDAQTN